MDRAEFEAGLRRDGYDVVAREMAPNTLNSDHTHDFDARVLVLSGSITMTMGGEARTYGPGDWWAVAAGTIHAETSGPEGVSFIAGRRRPAG